MKVIMLDFDGVINPWAVLSRNINRGRISEPSCIECLNKIITQTGAKVVITSSWTEQYELHELIDMLKADGFVGEVIGMTPSHVTPSIYASSYTYSNYPRGKEIQEWLDDHPDIINYVVLDDECFYKSDWMEGHENNMVNTDRDLGLLSDDANKAIRILNNEE